MESNEGFIAGVTVIAPEAPSDYHVAPRVESSTQAIGTPPIALSMPGAGMTMTGIFEKKKRGRPRKYGPNGAMGTSGTILSPTPISATPLPPSGDFPDVKPGTEQASGGFPSDKKGKPRVNASEAKPKHRNGAENLGDELACSTGGTFTPHVLIVNPGEDVSMKIIALSQQGPRSICIISASGVISNVTLRQTDTSGATLTYEGRFQILSLTGSFIPTEVGGSRLGRSGGISISLISVDGRVVGGVLAGLLIAASPVQIIVGSFLPSGYVEPKQKKQKLTRKPTTPAVGSPMPYAANVEQPIFVAHDPSHQPAGENTNGVAVSASLHSDDWADVHLPHDTRRSATDINIPLQGE